MCVHLLVAVVNCVAFVVCSDDAATIAAVARCCSLVALAHHWITCLTLAQVKEMGESGEGSLEQGVASGEVFILRYNSKFMEYYYAANPLELPTPASAPAPTPSAVEVGGGEDDEGVEENVKLEKLPPRWQLCCRNPR